MLVDSPVGCGKTSAIIKEAKGFLEKRKSSNERLIILTYYTDEIDRLIKETGFKQPLGIKREAIKPMIINGDFIVCTHALCEIFDSETKELFLNGEYKYHLIIDEIPQVVKNLVGNKRIYNKDNIEIIEKFSQKDYDLMQSANIIKINNETGIISWNNESPYNSSDYDKGVFDELKRYLVMNDLYSYNDNKTIIAMTKTDVWDCFKSIKVCGYFIKGSILENYLDFCKLEKQWQHVENGKFTEGYRFEFPNGLDRMSICFDDKYNVNESLSKNWFSNAKRTNEGKDKIKQISSKCRGFLNYYAKGIKSKQMIWTTFKEYCDILSGRQNSIKRWIPCNQKATNNYINCIAACYLCNRFLNVNLKNFLISKGLKVNDDVYALSELVQFVYRTNLRDSTSNQTVYIYIPSVRMRNLFNEWVQKGIENNQENLPDLIAC